ncbi:transcriptional regulator [Bacillaceae bacterium Marseille-Q3522]|nr:transcriptional regulator [Bacillaceae bacterium Marseille-Q3522]
MIAKKGTTKELILELMKQYGQVTIMELAEQLKISEMAVRKHIQALESDLLVQSKMKKQTLGRPSKVYQLSQQGEDLFPKKYKEFSLELLQQLKEMGQTALIEEIMKRRKEKQLTPYLHLGVKMTMSERIRALKRLQKKEGFMPEVRVEKDKVHFKEYNCPYTEIAKDFPTLCQCEKQFIQSFLQVKELKREAWMANGDSCCHYSFTKFG